MKFDETDLFKKDFKKLYKKYITLDDDLAQLKSVLAVIPTGNSRHFYIITKTDSFTVIKARFFCKALKKSSLRIVYIYYKNENRIKFVEAYFKGNKVNEDQSRWKSCI